MKKYLKFIALIIIVCSCKGPVTEHKNKLKNIQKYTRIATEASADLNIQKEEAIELNNLAKEIMQSEKKIATEYNEGDAQSKISNYNKKNKAKLKSDYDNLANAIISLSKCKGYEQLIFE